MTDKLLPNACPKPVAALPKRRAFNSTLPAPESSHIGRNAERRAKEFARCFGGTDRVEWIQSFPCVCCGKRPTDNMHVKGGGAGRRADARHVVPGCRTCHNLAHKEGIETLESTYSIDLQATADRFEELWLAYCTTQSPNGEAK